MAASEVLSDILQNIQKSNLNFKLNITPYSAYITIRKTFAKNCSPPAAVLTTVPEISVGITQDYCELKVPNIQLLEQVEVLSTAKQSAYDTIKLLEEKISKVEEAAFREFEEKKQEIVLLKKALTKQESDVIIIKKDLNITKKGTKEKEREICRIEQKNENLSDNIKRLKNEISNLKADNKKLSKKTSSSKSLVSSSSSSSSSTSPPNNNEKKLPVNDNDNISIVSSTKSINSNQLHNDKATISTRPVLTDTNAMECQNSSLANSSISDLTNTSAMDFKNSNLDTFISSDLTNTSTMEGENNSFATNSIKSLNTETLNNNIKTAQTSDCPSKSLENKCKISSEAYDNSEMVEELDDENGGKNQKERKTFMISEQEKAFLDQVSKIVLGTWRPKED